VTPKCPHFGTCAGCVLQHLDEDQQIVAKQRVLMDNLERIGHVKPGACLRRWSATAGATAARAGSRCAGSRRRTRPWSGSVNRTRASSPTCQCLTVIPEIGTKVAARRLIDRSMAS
jgi:23S rRNA (uracil1939-C5)-methyltransferase